MKGPEYPKKLMGEFVNNIEEVIKGTIRINKLDLDVVGEIFVRVNSCLNVLNCYILSTINANKDNYSIESMLERHAQTMDALLDSVSEFKEESKQLIRQIYSGES